MGLAETQLKMAECIPSPGKTNGTVVWVQRSRPSERTPREGGGGVGRPDRDRRGHWSRVAGLHGSHHPHQLQQTASNCSQRGKFVEKKKVTLGGSHNLNTKDVVLYVRKTQRVAFSRHLNCIAAIKVFVVDIFLMKVTLKLCLVNQSN